MPQSYTDTAVQASDLDNEKVLLQKLVLSTSALREDERQYWIDLIPSMDQGQIYQLKDILQSEQQNIQQIDKKYDQKLRVVGDKYLNKWDSEKFRSERLQRMSEEAKGAEESEEKAEELLKGW